MSDLFQWRPMSEAPRDGTRFVCLTTTIMGGSPMPFQLSIDMCVLMRSWWDNAERVGSGCWMTDSDCSRADYDVAGGYWMPEQDFHRAIIVLHTMGRDWRTAPAVGVVVFVRTKLREAWGQYPASISIAGDVSWVSPEGEFPYKRMGSKTFGRGMHPGYLDGENVGMGHYQWASLDEFMPEAALVKEREVKARFKAAGL